ncbi:putative Tetratricopeptide repeat protein [uncultured Gammaproteobacteria bacterium]
MKLVLLLATLAFSLVLAAPVSAQEASATASRDEESVNVSAESAFEAALGAFKARDYPKAHRYAESAYRQSSNTRKYADLYGWTLLKLERVNEAVTVYNRVYALDPFYIETIQLGAWLAYARRDLTTAQNEFHREMTWVESHRSNRLYHRYKRVDLNFIEGIAADANYGFGMLALDRGETESALAHLKTASESHNYLGRQDVFLALADAQTRKGDVAAATATLREASEKFGPEAVVPVLARTYLLSSNPAQAAELVAPLAAKSPKNPYFPMVQALGWGAAGRANEADQALAKALALSPNAFPAPDLANLVAGKSPAARQWLSGAGRRFYEQANFNGARILLYSQAAAGDCPSKLMAGWANHYAGYPAYAQGWFKDAANKGCAPREEAVLGQGAAELALGNTDVADKLFAQAVSINPNYGRAKAAQGAAAYFRKDYAGAVKIYAASLPALPASEPFWGWGANALNNLGWAYYFTGDYQKAEATFNRLNGYVRGQDLAAPKVGLGWSLLRQGKRDAARGWLDKALVLVPNYGLAKQGLAELMK